MATSKDILAQHKRAVHDGVATLLQPRDIVPRDIVPRDIIPRNIVQGDIVPRKHCSKDDIVPRTTLFQGKIITILD